jgi:hypothetical protein
MALAKVVQQFRDARLGIEKNSGRDDRRRTYPQLRVTWLRAQSTDSLSVLADGKENGIFVSRLLMRTSIFRDESPMTKADDLAESSAHFPGVSVFKPRFVGGSTTPEFQCRLANNDLINHSENTDLNTFRNNDASNR